MRRGPWGARERASRPRGRGPQPARSQALPPPPSVPAPHQCWSSASLPRLSVCFSLPLSLFPPIYCLALFPSNLFSLFRLCLLRAASLFPGPSQRLSHYFSLQLCLCPCPSLDCLSLRSCYLSLASLCLLPSLFTQHLYQSHLSPLQSLRSCLCRISLSLPTSISHCLSVSSLFLFLYLSCHCLSLGSLFCSHLLSPLPSPSLCFLVLVTLSDLLSLPVLCQCPFPSLWVSFLVSPALSPSVCHL